MERIEIIDRAEFFRRYPPACRAIRISGGGVETIIPCGDEIVCDFCNDLLKDEIYLYSDSHALCPKCGKKTAAEMCKKHANV